MKKIQKYIGIATLSIFLLGILYGIIVFFAEVELPWIFADILFYSFLFLLPFYLFNWLLFAIILISIRLIFKVEVKDFSLPQSFQLNSMSFIIILFFFLKLYSYFNIPSEYTDDFTSLGYVIKDYGEYGYNEMEINGQRGERGRGRNRKEFSEAKYKRELQKNAVYQIPEEFEFDKEVLIGFKATNNSDSLSSKETEFLLTDINQVKVEFLPDESKRKQFIVKELSTTVQSFNTSNSLYWFFSVKPIGFGYEKLSFRVSKYGNDNKANDFKVFDNRCFINTPLKSIIPLLIVDFETLLLALTICTFLVLSFFLLKSFWAAKNEKLQLPVEIKSQVKKKLQESKIKNALLILESHFEKNIIAIPYITTFLSTWSRIEKNELLNLVDNDTLNRNKSELTYKIIQFIDEIEE